MLNSYKIIYTKQCIVNLKTGIAFKGYFYKSNKNIIVLKNSYIIENGRDPIEVSGEVILDKSNIDFIQIINS